MDDSLVDSRKFCHQVEKMAMKNGVKFKYNQNVSNLKSSGNKITGFQIENGKSIDAEIVIICCAYWSTLFSEIKSNLMITPMRGMSLDLYGCRNEVDYLTTQVTDYTSGDLNYQICPFGKGESD